jgi:hypothetical protein
MTFSWYLRTAVVTTILTIVLHLPDSPHFGYTFPFFAILSSCFCSLLTLGGAARNAVQLSSGAIVGGGVAAAILAAAGAPNSPPLFAQWLSLIFFAFFSLLIPAPASVIKLGLAVFITAILSAGEMGGDAGGGFQAVFAPLLGALIGALAAYLITFMFGARARTHAHNSRIDEAVALGRAVRLATSAFASPEPLIRVARARALASTHSEAVKHGVRCAAAENDSAWEFNWASLSGQKHHAAQKIRLVSLKIDTATAMNAIDSLGLALQAAIVGDARLREGVSSTTAAAARVLREVPIPSSRGGGGAFGNALEVNDAALRAASNASFILDASLSGPAKILAKTSSIALIARVKSGAETAVVTSAIIDAENALIIFDEALIKARTELFYSAHGGEAADAASLVALAIYGVPTGRYLFVHALRAFAIAALGKKDTPTATSSTTTSTQAVPCLVPTSLNVSTPTIVTSPILVDVTIPSATLSTSPPPPPPPLPPKKLWVPSVTRLIYATRLTVAIAFAAALSRVIFGTGVWAATAIAFVGPRDSGSLSGGALHAALLRVGGTIAGAVVGLGASFMLTAGAGTIVTALALGVWVAFVGSVRSSPRHAYGAIVAQFTPYLLIDAPSFAATSWALARVAQNMLGLAIFAAVEVAVAPTSTADASRTALKGALIAAATVARSSADHLATSTSAAVAAVNSSVERQTALLREAADEEGWTPFRCVCFSIDSLRGRKKLNGNIHHNDATKARDATAHAARLLSTVISIDGFGEGAGSQLCTSTQSALFEALANRYDALADELLKSNSSHHHQHHHLDNGIATNSINSHHHTDQSAEILHRAALTHDSELHGAFVALVRGSSTNVSTGVTDIVPINTIVTAVVIAWAANELAENSKALAHAVHYFGDGHRLEREKVYEDGDLA